jgi:hypothetical protein
LSIVVPVGDCVSAYENTLISVLENRPTECEVLVVHDGSYDDPFDLSDEVRFVVADSSWLGVMVSEAARFALGRYVHVLGQGVCATPGWTDSALHKFEQSNIGFVAPVIRQHDSNRILAAGWRDHAGRLCDPVGAGKKQLSAIDLRYVDGGYLQASFWRRELLTGLSETYRTTNDLDCMYAHTLLMSKAGWKAAVDETSVVEYSHARLAWDQSSLSRGRRLRAIHDLVTEQRCSLMGVAVRSLLSHWYAPSRYAESIGQATAGWVRGATNRRLDSNVSRYENNERRVSISQANETRRTEIRRAA